MNHVYLQKSKFAKNKKRFDTEIRRRMNAISFIRVDISKDFKKDDLGATVKEMQEDTENTSILWEKFDENENQRKNQDSIGLNIRHKYSPTIKIDTKISMKDQVNNLKNFSKKSIVKNNQSDSSFNEKDIFIKDDKMDNTFQMLDTTMLKTSRQIGKKKLMPLNDYFDFIIADDKTNDDKIRRIFEQRECEVKFKKEKMIQRKLEMMKIVNNNQVINYNTYTSIVPRNATLGQADNVSKFNNMLSNQQSDIDTLFIDQRPLIHKNHVLELTEFLMKMTYSLNTSFLHLNSLEKQLSLAKNFFYQQDLYSQIQNHKSEKPINYKVILSEILKLPSDNYSSRLAIDDWIKEADSKQINGSILNWFSDIAFKGYLWFQELILDLSSSNAERKILMKNVLYQLEDGIIQRWFVAEHQRDCHGHHQSISQNSYASEANNPIDDIVKPKELVKVLISFLSNEEKVKIYEGIEECFKQNPECGDLWY